MNMLATGAFLSGDDASARRWYDAGLTLQRGMDNNEAIVAMLHNFGRFERDQGNLARSRELLSESLTISRACDNDPDVAFAVKELGMTAIEGDAFAETRELLAEGFEIAARLGLTVIAGDLIFASALLCDPSREAE